MEAFSLLKYWRGGGVGLGASSDTTTSNASANTTTTILASVAQNENATESDGDGDDDEGPFFDLEFAVPDEVDGSEDGHENPNTNCNNQELEEEEEEEEEEEGESDGEGEFKITLSPSSNDRSDGNLSVSPSEDLFFKGKLVQVEPSSFVLNPSESEPNSKPQFTSSLLKSATKFRVFMLGLKKPKPESVPHQTESQKKHRAERIKFKVEEVPIVSLFTRDNSSRGNNKSQSQSQSQPQNAEESPSISSEEKRFSKEVVMHKYLKMVKPLYIRVSRRYGDKLGQLGSNSGGKASAAASASASEAATVTAAAEAEGETVAENAGNNVKSQKQGNLPAGLRVVYKHLGKSRSASSAVAASPPAFVSSKRRDDSLLQQQDGIQGAILHCKRSFNASRGECESSQLPRSVSDPLREISPELSRKSNDKRI